MTIDAPGVYDLTAEEYHADPVPGGSLSSSGARLLLPPSCPAVFRHQTDNPQPANRVYDLGHAAHALVLGHGDPIVPVGAEDWRTKAAKAQRDQAYSDGAVPLLAAEYQQVQAMAAALRAHPVASALFMPGSGEPERSLFWRDGPTWLRARLDWLARRPEPGRRLIVADYKTTASADPQYLSRAMHTYGYHCQAAWYLDAVTALDLAGDTEPAFVLVFQEKAAPYLVTIVQPDPIALRWGRTLNRKALDIYRRCVASGQWPGYAKKILSLPLPPWAERAYDAADEAGDYDIEGAIL